MTIQFVTAGNAIGLFNRLGKMGIITSGVRTYQNTTIDTPVVALENMFVGTPSPSNPEPDIEFTIPTSELNNRNGVGGINQDLVSLATNTIIRMVWRDNPQNNRVSGQLALQEIIRQMILNAQTVQKCTVTATSSVVSIVGNGVIALSTKRPDGLVQENLLAEVAKLVCIQDSYSGGTAAGGEVFQFQGAASAQGVFDWQYPLGSGVITSVPPCNPTTGTIITNGDFELWTGSVPNGWTITVGGGTVSKDTGSPYTGTSDLKIAGDGATLTALTQTVTVRPLTQYGINLWTKTSAAPAAGVLTIELIDGNSAVINDAQGVPNSFTVNLVTIGTTYAPTTAFFRLPAKVITPVKVRLRLSTTLSNTVNLFVDRLGLVQSILTYSGGEYINTFSGSTPWVTGDNYTVTTTNDIGGASNLNNFQCLFRRYFNMPSLGLLLPSSGTPTISDGLIS